MLEFLIKAIFFIIGKIGDIIFSPLMAVVNVLFTNVSLDLDNVFTYLEMGFNYIPFVLKCLLIPRNLTEIVVIVFTLYLGLVNGIRIYQFTLRIYNYFKT